MAKAKRNAKGRFVKSKRSAPSKRRSSPRRKRRASSRTSLRGWLGF